MTRRWFAALVVATAGLAIAAPAGQAEPGPLTSFTARTVDAADNPVDRAGTYPDRVIMDLSFDPTIANLRDVVIDFPPGFSGGTQPLPACPREDATLGSFGVGCPPESQVGHTELVAGGFPASAGIYNVEAGPDNPLMLTFGTFFASGRFFATILPDGTPRFTATDFSQDTSFRSMRIELWGVPADHQSVSTPRRGLLATPTDCNGQPPTAKVEVRSWEPDQPPQHASAALGPPLTGCDTLDAEPGVELALGAPRTDSPTGLRMTVAVPQSEDLDSQVTARPKAIAVRFPEGVALSPGVASTVTACPEEAVGLGEPGATGCPASARIGDAEIHSPILEEAIPGAIYMGRQQGATDYRMYVAIRGRGIDVKLAGTLHADPLTGRISAEFPDIPQLPFDRMTLSFAGGPRAPLATPLVCGQGTHSVTLTPYGGAPPASATAETSIGADPEGRPCPSRLPFAPSMVAGTTVARAGAAAPLAVTIRRRPGDQLLGGFGMTLPKGLSAKLGAVPRCAAAAAASGACPRQSRIGRAVTEAGSGAAPLALDGDAFLTGPYRGAPFGMAMVFQGIAGPFDLGTIVVRAALRVDRLTGQVTIDVDPLPTVLSGIPLRIQTVALDVDRPGFIRNPTSCAPTRISAVAKSSAGDVSRQSSRFALGGCRKLRFRPEIATALTDPDELERGGHPGFRLRLRSATRGANLRGLEVDLPKLLQPSPTGPTAVCSLTQLDKGRCPAASRVGSASARSPILSEPLRGPVYQTQPPWGVGPPDAWALVEGMGVSMRFKLRTRVEGGRLRGEIDDLPDIPLTSLVLSFAGGDQGLFTADRDACAGGRARPMRAALRLTAHSAAKRRLQPRVRVPGC